MVTGGLAAFVMLADNAPGVMTKYVVHVLLEGCGVATCGLALWGMLFGKKEQRLTQLGLVTVSAVCFALMAGIGKMIK